MKDLTIREFQTQLPWTIHYSKEFRESGLKHKDFQHALIHSMKALGKLSAYVDNLEHNKESEVGDIGKYIADCVICALRMANTAPAGAIDLQEAVHTRLEGKNGIQLKTEPEQKSTSGITYIKANEEGTIISAYINDKYVGYIEKLWGANWLTACYFSEKDTFATMESAKLWMDKMHKKGL